MSFEKYSEYRSTGDEFIGEIPAHWQLKDLGSISWVRARLGWKGLKAEEYVDDGYIFLSTPNLKGNRIDFDQVNYISQERFDESPEIKLRLGDVLIAKDGSTLGTANLVRTLPREATVNSSIAVVTPASELDSGFLFYQVVAESFQERVHFLKGGMGVPHLFQRDLNRFPVPVPPLAEQQAIYLFLESEIPTLDALITEQQRLIELLTEKRQAVISHAVTKGLSSNVPMKDSGVEWIGKTVSGWLVTPIRHVARLESGHTPSRSHPQYWAECTVPWFTLADVWQIRENKADYIFETKEKISELGLANSAARLLPKGTVILSRTASVGFSAIMGVDMATTQDFANWVCGERVLPEFLLLCFRSMGKEFERLRMGSVHNTIYMPDIRAFRMALPPKQEQQEIVGYCYQRMKEFDELIAEAQKAVHLLHERRCALITAAVTGKIDVRDYQPTSATRETYA